MGRPIKEKFFGNTNSPYSNQAQGGGTGVGGEGANVITVSNSGTLYSQGTTVAISAPQIPGGVAATISASINGAGNIAVTKLTEGTGYTSAPTLTVTKAATVTSTVNSGLTATNTFTVSTTAGISIGMLIAGAATGSSGYVTAINSNVITSTVNNNGPWTNASNLTFTDNGSGFASSISLTSTKQNAIKGEAYVAGGSQKAFDIKKQEASKRYLVQTADGTDQCKLVTTSTLAAGEMNIEAVDTNGSKYYVRKLTARRAVLVQTTASGSFVYANNSAAGWTLGSASAGIVSIGNN
jgi:hypothetical protein